MPPACARRLAFVAVLAALVAVAPTPSAARECQEPADASYDIDLVVDIPPARLYHDRSLAELGRMSVHRPNARVLGLARTDLDFGWRVRADTRALDGGYCFWVTGVELTIRYPAPDIYVAREYRKGSCQYRAILAHEQQHVAASRALLDRYRPRLRWVLTSLRIPTAQRPVAVGSPAEAKRRVRDLMQDLAEPLFREMAAALTETQAKLDSAASYRRLRARCRRW